MKFPRSLHNQHETEEPDEICSSEWMHLIEITEGEKDQPDDGLQTKRGLYVCLICGSETETAPFHDVVQNVGVIDSGEDYDEDDDDTNSRRGPRQFTGSGNLQRDFDQLKSTIQDELDRMIRNVQGSVQGLWERMQQDDDRPQARNRGQRRVDLTPDVGDDDQSPESRQISASEQLRSQREHDQQQRRHRSSSR